MPVLKVAHRPVRRSGSAMSAKSDKSVSDEAVLAKALPEGAAPDEAAREALLDRAAGCWAKMAPGGEKALPGEQAPPGDGVVDVPGFLREYYRLVATEDLVPAGPERVAAVAARHVALGAVRPQGRALVTVGAGVSRGTAASPNGSGASRE